MTVFSEFHFLRPLWLALLPVTVGLWWLIRRHADPLRGWRAVMNPQLLAALTVGSGPRAGGRGIVLLVGWLLATISLAGPVWKPEPSPFSDDPVPVMVLLRAGESMDLSDLSPSRMERARLKVVDFANARQGQPTGLIAWAGSAHLVLPPTRDTDVVGTMAMEISPDIMPRPGDDLGAALRLAEKTLGELRGSLVVVADTVSPDSSASLQEFARNSRLPVCILAVAREGTPEMEDLSQAAAHLNSRVTPLTADQRDVQALAKLTANVPIAVSDAAEGVRWSESGWWLVPVLAMMSLIGFRRVEEQSTEEPSS